MSSNDAESSYHGISTSKTLNKWRLLETYRDRSAPTVDDGLQHFKGMSAEEMLKYSAAPSPCTTENQRQSLFLRVPVRFFRNAQLIPDGIQYPNAFVQAATIHELDLRF